MESMFALPVKLHEDRFLSATEIILLSSDKNNIIFTHFDQFAGPFS